MSDKKCSFVTCRLTAEERDEAQRLADALGCTVSRLARSLIARECECLRVSGLRDSQVDRLVYLAELAAVQARAAVEDGEVDTVERAELTRIEAEFMHLLWGAA